MRGAICSTSCEPGPLVLISNIFPAAILRNLRHQYDLIVRRKQAHVRTKIVFQVSRCLACAVRVPSDQNQQAVHSDVDIGSRAGKGSRGLEASFVHDPVNLPQPCAETQRNSTPRQDGTDKFCAAITRHSPARISFSTIYQRNNACTQHHSRTDWIINNGAVCGLHCEAWDGTPVRVQATPRYGRSGAYGRVQGHKRLASSMKPVAHQMSDPGAHLGQAKQPTRAANFLHLRCKHSLCRMLSSAEVDRHLNSGSASDNRRVVRASLHTSEAQFLVRDFLLVHISPGSLTACVQHERAVCIHSEQR